MPVSGSVSGQVGEGEDVGGIEGVQKRMAVARRLGEAMVEASAARSGHVRHHAVEDAAALFIAIETVIKERAQETSALGDAEAVGAFDVVVLVAEQGVVSDAVVKEGDEVADGGGAEADERRILRLVDQFVDAAGIEAGLQDDVGAAFDMPGIARQRRAFAIG